MTKDSVKEHKFIIFCGHSINALGIIRSLHQVQIDPIAIFIRNAEVNYVECSRFIGKKHYVDDSMQGLELLLLEYGSEEYPPFVFTADDYHTMLLDQNYEKLAGRFYFFNCGESMRLTSFQYKDEQCRAAKEAGFVVPAWEVVEKGAFPKTLCYPVITKSISSNEGGWKKDVFVCNNEEELDNAYKKITASRLLLEEYVQKKCEITLHGFSVNAGQQVFIPFYSEDYVFSRTGFGNFLTFQPVENPSLLDRTIKLIQTLKYSGLFGIDMTMDKTGELLFFEINLRSDARNYGVTAGGANLPLLWAQTTIGEALPTDLSLRKKFYVVDEIPDIMWYKKNPWKWMSDLSRADVYLWYYKHDNAPIWRYFKSKMIKGAKKFFSRWH